MDTPKNGKCFIVNFPPETWASIACFLYGENLARLKMCGSKLLWRKLTLPGVVKSINLGKQSYQIETWPTFLNDLPSVSELSIDSNTIRWHTKQWWSQSWARLGLMPPKLRKLEIKNVGNVLVNEYGTPSYIDKHLPRLEVLSLSTPLRDEQWMSRCPKSLTDLTIDRWNGEVSLPPSLIHLKILACKDFWTPTMKLPTRLQTLQISSAPPVSLLVPPLKSLTITYYNKFFESLENIRRLPSTLTELSTASWISCTFWPHLPQNLTKITFGPIVGTEDSVLREVSDPTTGAKISVRTLPLELLPRSLTFLDLDRGQHVDSLPLVPLDAPKPPTSSYFPPKLKTLKVGSFYLTLKAARTLPNSLTHLELNNLHERLCEHLPSGLTTLKSFGMCSSPNLFKLLPRSLVDLELCEVGEYLRYDLETGEPTVSEKSWTLRPASFYDAKSLPSGLTSLKLLDCHGIDDTFFEDLALQNLLSLDFHGANLTDRCIPLLPRHLTSFRFGSETISASSFPFLPRNLLYLCLSRTSVSDSDIPHLPRTLTYADLRQYDSRLTSNCLRDLPRELHTLSLDDESILENASINDLPYALRRYAENYF